MASLFAGTPQQAPSYAATTSDVPKWLQDYTVDLFSQQRAVSGTPYQPYELPRIAQQTAPTTAAYDLIQKNIGAYQPTVQNAITGTQGLAGQSSVSNIGAYMNPYTQNVTDQIAKLGARNLSENLLPAVSDQFIKAGQFGSSGMGTFGNRALRDTQESILANQASALQSGYTQALGASQADLTRQQGALAQTADLAKAQQGLSTADAAALQSIGAEQQAQQQKGLDVGYQDFLAQRNFPQEQINAMSTTLRGLPANATPTTGTTSSYKTEFAPSTLGQIAGAYSLFQGVNSAQAQKALGAAKGGVVNGYADGGVVSGGEDLHGAVMADYGKYFKRGGEVEGYAMGGFSKTMRKNFDLMKKIGLSNNNVPLQQRSLANLTGELDTIKNAGYGAGVAVPGGDVAAYTKQLEDAIAANNANTTQTHYALSAPNVALAAPVSMPANLEELNAKYYEGGDPYGKYLGQGYSHGGMVPGYAEDGYVDTQDPAPMVDGGQAFADQYAQGQLEYPTQQDAPVMAAPTMSYMQDPEVLAANAERKALLKQLQTSLANAPTGRDVGPTESEMWFNRAAAFLDPGKTGSFGEGLQHLSAVEAAHRAEQRKAKVANQAADLQRLQARSELAQKQYEMTMDEGKRRTIEQLLTPASRSTQGATVGGGAGIPDNMKAMILSLDPAEAIKTIIDIAKENNSPKTAIGGINFAVEAGIITREEGNAAIKQAIQPKVDMAKLYIPELGTDADLTQAELIKYTASGVIPTRYTGEKPTPAQSFMANTPSSLAPADATQGATAPSVVPTATPPAVRPRTKEQVAAETEQLKESGKKKVEAADILLGQREAINDQLSTVRRFKSIVNKDPSIIGLTNKPGIGAAFVEAAKQGIRIGDFPVSINLEEPIAKATLSEEQLANRDFAKQQFQDLIIGYRKMFLKGEGPVSNMEGALVEKLPPGMEDTYKGFMLKAGIVEIRAEKKQAVVNGFSTYLQKHPTAGPEDYYNTPEFKRISDTYDNKYSSFFKQNGFDLGKLASPAKKQVKPSSDKFDVDALFNALDKDPRAKGR